MLFLLCDEFAFLLNQVFLIRMKKKKDQIRKMTEFRHLRFLL
ncbi:hypothetical protein CHCC15381_4607 [Bacillus paralicheniformis]|uniref:Uncharacterized protein n=1 Tax=Bacillus paralicheniformis TaxID=1648923 RepID=A0ABY3FQR5_9BACI|nr:hypothetical protein CHCC15381_4607 [Bacillus paralicheniformis]